MSEINESTGASLRFDGERKAVALPPFKDAKKPDARQLIKRAPVPKPRLVTEERKRRLEENWRKLTDPVGACILLLSSQEDRTVEPRGLDFKSGDLMGDGRLWSLTGLLVCDGRYRIFKDGSGWFACDVSAIVTGSILELELSDGARVTVQVTRKAERNFLFRPAAVGAPNPTQESI